MSRQSLGQKGFSAIETLLCIIIVAIIGGTGFYIYHANQKTNNTFDAASRSANSSPAKATKKAPKSDAAQNPLLFSDDTGKVYQVSLLAKTADEKSIASAFDKACSTVLSINATSAADMQGHKVVGVISTPEIFTGSELNKNNGKFARISGACYDKTEGGAQWGGGAGYFFAKQNGTWIYVTASQGQVDCDVLDGKETGDLVPQCFDTNTQTERAPKQ